MLQNSKMNLKLHCTTNVRFFKKASMGYVTSSFESFDLEVTNQVGVKEGLSFTAHTFQLFIGVSYHSFGSSEVSLTYLLPSVHTVSLMEQVEMEVLIESIVLSIEGSFCVASLNEFLINKNTKVDNDSVFYSYGCSS
eukprot:GDKJ01056013.1.p1 GENE.GDKJ01056013.1~~GDKJ01056013.1.p1  ORF type:complete len:137 (-),score=17.73 GDKJ01056013.1:1932-2342(-)